MNSQAAFYLSWYSIKNDRLVGQEKLPRAVTEKKLRKWFYIREDDPNLDGHIVRASQRMHLQKVVSHQINLNEYDYFLEHLAD